MMVPSPGKKMTGFTRTPDRDPTKPYVMWAGDPLRASHASYDGLARRARLPERRLLRDALFSETPEMSILSSQPALEPAAKEVRRCLCIQLPIRAKLRLTFLTNSTAGGSVAMRALKPVPRTTAFGSPISAVLAPKKRASISTISFWRASWQIWRARLPTGTRLISFIGSRCWMRPELSSWHSNKLLADGGPKPSSPSHAGFNAVIRRSSNIFRSGGDDVW
jgi:hypothetical protein